jgi:hypothetical protein
MGGVMPVVGGDRSVVTGLNRVAVIVLADRMGRGGRDHRVDVGHVLGRRVRLGLSLGVQVVAVVVMTWRGMALVDLGFIAAMIVLPMTLITVTLIIVARGVVVVAREHRGEARARRRAAGRGQERVDVRDVRRGRSRLLELHVVAAVVGQGAVLAPSRCATRRPG